MPLPPELLRFASIVPVIVTETPRRNQPSNGRLTGNAFGTALVGPRY